MCTSGFLSDVGLVHPYIWILNESRLIHFLIMKTGPDVILLSLTAGCKFIIRSLPLFFYFCPFLFYDFPPMKGENSSHSGVICSVPFDIKDGSSAGDDVSCKLSISPDVIDDSTDQQKEPNQNQTNTKPQNSSVGAEDEITETERQVPDADTADKTEEIYNEENEKGAEDVFRGFPHDSEIVMVEEREEQEASLKSGSEVDDPSVRPRSGIKSPELSLAANGKQKCGPLSEPGVDEVETEQTQADLGAEAQSPEEAELKDEEKEEDNPERSCSADADSTFVVSKDPESLICRKKDHIWERECRSFKHLKVLQTAAIASQ